MEYITRTQQTKYAILKNTHLTDEIRSIFNSHIRNKSLFKPVGTGNSRCVYKIGKLKITSKKRLNIILKLELKYSKHLSELYELNYQCEFGAFEVYYDFVNLNINSISFTSYKKYKQYLKCRDMPKIKSDINLAENWGGTKVQPGDIGAIPYFFLLVTYKGWIGQITEGIPSFHQSHFTAKDNYPKCIDENTVEKGRIIDLGSSQCLLIEIDKGSLICTDKNKCKDFLGIRLKGEKYFFPENRLDL